MELQEQDLRVLIWGLKQAARQKSENMTSIAYAIGYVQGLLDAKLTEKEMEEQDDGSRKRKIDTGFSASRRADAGTGNGDAGGGKHDPRPAETKAGG